MLMNKPKKLKTPHKFDAVLALAYETLEQEKCQKCGLPIWYAYSEDNSIKFEHDHIDCWSCAFDEVESKKIRDPQPGRTMYVKAVPEDGFDKLPSRQDFQMEMMKKAAKAVKPKAEE